MISDRIYAFLARQRLESPCLVLDLDVVGERYRAYARALPNTKIYYAVKASPHPAILELLVELGSSFDAAAIQRLRRSSPPAACLKTSPMAIQSKKNATLLKP